MTTDSSTASAPTVTVRIFGSLRPLRTARGLPHTLTFEVPQGGIAARDLAVSLELPPEKIEGVFVNHVVHGIDVHVSPGDRVAAALSRSALLLAGGVEPQEHAMRSRRVEGHERDASG